MFFLILTGISFLLLNILILVFYAFDDFYDYSYYNSDEISATFLASLIVGAIMYLVLPVLQKPHFEYENKLIQTQEIYSLQDNFQTNERFILGSGRIESDLYYYFLIEEGNGYIVNKRDAERTIIVFDDKPTLQKYQVIATAEDWYSKQYLGFVKKGKITYELHIPEDAVTKKIEIDLE